MSVRTSTAKSKGCICDPKRRPDQIRVNPYCRALHAGDVQSTRCTRCGDPSLGSTGGDAKARPFRKALRGLCTPCVVCSFFQDEENGLGFALPPDFDPEGLRLPHIQRQFARILAVGKSELTMEEIDWDKVIQKWVVAGA